MQLKYLSRIPDMKPTYILSRVGSQRSRPGRPLSKWTLQSSYRIRQFDWLLPSNPCIYICLVYSWMVCNLASPQNQAQEASDGVDSHVKVLLSEHFRRRHTQEGRRGARDRRTLSQNKPARRGWTWADRISKQSPTDSGRPRERLHLRHWRGWAKRWVRKEPVDNSYVTLYILLSYLFSFFQS
jgi:hypothetical protein